MLKTVSATVAVVSMGFLVAGCQSSDQTTTFTGSTTLAVSAKSGQKTVLTNLFKVNPDCSSARTPNVEIISGPTHGSAKIERTSVLPTYKPGHVLNKCNSHRISSVAPTYVSSPGYVGKDYVRVSARLPGNPVGYYNHYDFRIDVTK